MKTKNLIPLYLVERIARIQNGQDLHRDMGSRGQDPHSDTARISQGQNLFQDMVRMCRE
jgi:hypothetical protein